LVYDTNVKSLGFYSLLNFQIMMALNGIFGIGFSDVDCTGARKLEKLKFSFLIDVYF